MNNQKEAISISEVEFNEAYKNVLLQTFKATIDFLEAHHIRWCVCGGSCLGAVRHKGIIPWDDDIDIFVIREDYERLFDIRKELAVYNLSMKSIEDGYGYYNGFIKIFNKNTTLWELKKFPEIVGVYIDVFPVEKSDIDKEEYMRAQNEYRDAMKNYCRGLCKSSFRDLYQMLIHFHWGDLWERLICIAFPHNRSAEYKRFLESTRIIKCKPEGKFSMCLMGSYLEREHCPAEWFSSTIAAPFADFTVKLPVGYDGYLSQLYGDYMQLPPKEKQVSHHYHYYCNLKEGLSLEEVKQRIKQGEYVVI